MLDHVGFPVSDLRRSRAFYSAALDPLGIIVMAEVTSEQTGGHGAHVGFGVEGKPFFWIGDGKTAQGTAHFAFGVKDRATVAAFYDAAIQAGGKDNGAPGLRPHFHANYYGAYVIDPDGNNIEAVCHREE